MTDFQKLLLDVKYLFARFETEQEQAPTKVWIPLARQNDLCSATADEVGEVIAKRLTVDGPKEAFHKLGNLEIVWQEPVLAVGVDDSTRATLE